MLLSWMREREGKGEEAGIGGTEKGEQLKFN